MFLNVVAASIAASPPPRCSASQPTMHLFTANGISLTAGEISNGVARCARTSRRASLPRDLIDDSSRA